MRRSPRLLRWMPLLVLVPACSDQGPPPACTGTVTATVSAGTTPTFSWTPACSLEGLIVALPGPGALAWRIESTTQTNTIAPPVTYGVTPAGAQAPTAPTALVTGTTYDLSLLRLDDHQGGTIQPAGSATFAP